MAKTYRFATLDGILSALNEERIIRREDVRPSLRNATIWQAMESLSGGYMPHNRGFYRSRRAAVDGACESARMADDYAGRAPNGMRTDLMAGYSFHKGGYCYEVVSVSVAECCA